MFIGYLLLTIALTEFVLGLWFIFGYRRQQVTLWYGMFALGVAIYVGANGFGFARIIDANTAEHWAWTGGMMTAVFILPFSYCYPIVRKTLQELMVLSVWPLLVIVPGLLFSPLFVAEVPAAIYGKDYTTPFGPYFWWMMAFFIIYWTWGIRNFLLSYRTSDGMHLLQLRALTAGLVLSVVAATFFDVALPLFHIVTLGFVGSLFSSIWLGFTSYILVKK